MTDIYPILWDIGLYSVSDLEAIWMDEAVASLTLTGVDGLAKKNAVLNCDRHWRDSDQLESDQDPYPTFFLTWIDEQVWLDCQAWHAANNIGNL